MPRLEIDGHSHEVRDGQRLVLAIEGQGIQIGHRCGGNARCTTCRVEFRAGEPDRMTRAEHDRLQERGLLGQYRLSCQILCDHDMGVHPVLTLQSEGWTDTGPPPERFITPEPEWIDRPDR